jgi:hypothetical protein
MERRDMSAVGLQFAIKDPVNPFDLSAQMGISLETLSKATHVDLNDLAANPTAHSQARLRPVANLWLDLTATFGGGENAKLFLNLDRPELMDKTPLYYLEQGEPEIVQHLVHAIREMLP